MSDKNCGDMNDNGVLKNPNKIRKSNAASSLVKTFGRSFKIRKSNILSTIPSALVSRENMPDIEADNKYYISSLTDEQVQRLYFAELDDLIEKECLKEQLKRKSISEMRTFLMLYRRRDNLTTAVNPCSYINELITHQRNVKKCHSILSKLLISLKNEGLSWIKKLQDQNIFGLFEVCVSLAKQFTDKLIDNILIHCLYCCARIVHVISNTGFGFNKFCANPSLLSVAIYFICLLMNEFSQDNVLNLLNKEQTDEIKRIQRISIDLLIVFLHQNTNIILMNMMSVAKPKNQSRFQFVVDTLVNADDDMKTQCLSLLAALFTCKGHDVFYRIQIRSELSRIGLFRYIKELSDSQPGDNVQLAIDRLQRCTEEHYLNGSNSCNSNDPITLFRCLLSRVEGSASEKHLISMLHHLLLIHDNSISRDSFYRIFDMLISRIIKQKRIVDSDDEESLSTLVWDDLSEIIHKSSLTSIGSMSTIDDLQSLASQARTSDDQNSICTNECMNDDVTICAEIDNSPQTNTDNMQTNADMVTIEETAPPELPLPSPLPPPPPLPPSLSGMLSGNGINTRCMQLPRYLKVKKKYEVNGNMKRLTWRKIETNEIKENSLWAQVDESKYASQSFCSKLENEFTICTNKISAKTIQHPVDDKLFYFLDAKTAQNLAIMMGFLKVSPEQISKWILECDETNLTITSLEQILRCFSNTTAISEIKSILEGHNDLQNPEKLLFSLCEIPMLPQRLKCLIFKKQFSELHDECKTSIQKSIRACRKIRRSSEFKTIIEILLTSGNYINSTFKSYDCVYGFKFDFLPKVISTKTALNDRSLLHIILDHINCHDKSAIDAIIQHQKICESASRVESSEISKIIGDIRNGVECVKQFLNDSNPDDQFHIVLKIFLSESESKLDQLIDLQCSMQNEHVQLAEYLSFDVKQINEFFANLHEFICHVKQCKSEIDASKEANEKRRVRQHTSQTIAKKREANSKRRQKVQPYNQPVVVKDEEENVMDKLLAVLNESDARFVKRIPQIKEIRL